MSIPRFVRCALLAAACYRAEDWKPSRPGEIFRYAAVGTWRSLDSIVLGQPWTTATKYGARPTDTVNTLPAGTFGGADAIRVRRNARGIVTALEFDYDRARNVDAIIKEYESDLGPPEVTIDSTGAGQRRFSTWRNSTTEFRIIEFTPPVANSVVATAILSDK